MNTSILDTPESVILSRVIAPDSSGLSEHVARELLRWEFTEADRQRMSQLASKARAGALRPEETEEAEAYERVSSFLGLVKSKARQSLQKIQDK